MGVRMDPLDIVGSQFGELTVASYIGKKGKYHDYHCLCSCGRETDVERNNLRSGHTTTCGFCSGKKCDPTDIIGKKFGSLTPLDYFVNQYGTYMYHSRCECGRYQTSPRSCLLSGRTVSCAYCAGRKADFSDIIGRRFGSLVVKVHLGKINEKHLYRCHCDCGKEKVANRSDLLRGDVSSCGDCTHIENEGDHYRYVCEDGDSWIFDEMDLELVSSRKWYISHDGYPHSKTDGKDIPFHRLALGLSDEEVADHINRDSRDNRRCNIRPAAQIDNTKNQTLRNTNSSGYKGVSFLQCAGKFEAYINDKPYHKKHLGLFETPEEAARAYDEAARYFYGEFACVNFPNPGEQGCRKNQETERTDAVA